VEEVAMTVRSDVWTPSRLDARAVAELLAIGTALVFARLALRGLHLPGHAELPTLFALLLARGRVRHVGAALLAGAPAAAACAVGWIGGPEGALSLVLAAVVVEALGARVAGFARSALACAAIGAAAAATRAVLELPAILAAPGAAAAGHGLFTAVAHAGFGALGAVLVPPVLRHVRPSGPEPESD
jgi:hypothetical protein